MAEHSVVGIYDTMAQAEKAVHTLDQASFPVKQVSIVTQNLASDQTMHGSITPGDDLTPRGAATGAWFWTTPGTRTASLTPPGRCGGGTRGRRYWQLAGGADQLGH
jgi:hypothetical protein